MKKTLLALGVILAVAIACQVNDPEKLPLSPSGLNPSAALDDVFSVTEETAAFPGGTEAWKAFIQENLVLPESDVEGRVFASFVVDKAGELHNIQLIRGIGGGADEAVLDLLKKSPNWQAGKQRGQAVNSRISVFIQFGEAERDLMPKKTIKPAGSIEFDQVYIVPEEIAVYPGGIESWNRFIDENLTKAQFDVKGRVFASFIVDKEGALHNIQLTRGIGGGADEAVLELLKKSPNWQAAKQRGRLVNSRMQVAITFH